MKKFGRSSLWLAAFWVIITMACAGELTGSSTTDVQDEQQNQIYPKYPNITDKEVGKTNPDDRDSPVVENDDSLPTFPETEWEDEDVLDDQESDSYFEDEFEEETPLVESDPFQYYTPARGQTYYPEEMSFVFLQGRTYLHFKVEGIDYLTPAGGGYMSVQLRGTISTAVHINGTGSAEIRTTSYSAYDAWKQAEIKAENWERTPPPPIGEPRILMPPP